MRAFFEQDGFGSLHQDHKIHPEIPVADIPDIQIDAGCEIHIVPPAHLPQSRDPRTHREDGVTLPADLFAFAEHIGPWADEAHLAAKYIEDLRQLIERGAPQKMADRGDAGVIEVFMVFRIVVDLFGMLREIALQYLIAVDIHRAKFIADESVAFLAQPLLLEQRGAVRLCFAYLVGDISHWNDQERHDQKQKRQIGNTLKKQTVSAFKPILKNYQIGSGVGEFIDEGVRQIVVVDHRDEDHLMVFLYLCTENLLEGIQLHLL